MFYNCMVVVLLVAACLLHTSAAMPRDAEWGQDELTAGRFRRQAQGFGGQQGGFGGQQGGFGGASGGYGIKNWYNTPEGWGYDATYPGGETHFHSKRGGGGQGGRGGSY